MKRITIFASAKQIHLMVGRTSLKTILEGFFIIRPPIRAGYSTWTSLSSTPKVYLFRDKLLTRSHFFNQV